MSPITNLSHLKKILIANRGEIACRIIKTAKRLGIKTVAVYSEADTNCMHVSLADEAYNIGKPQSQESYLRGDKIIKVAAQARAQAIHPGYGFLSENAEFAKLCADNSIIFIGPPASAIRDMGIKSTSKNIMDTAGVPIIPGYHGDEQADEILIDHAKKIGFPLMIKAVRGGGGKGMRIAFKESEFKEALESARRESLRAFGDEAVLLERYIEKPRHIEVQIFGDTHGNYVHLFERDCSVQRRHQKVIEQAPAPGITDNIRTSLGNSAVKAAQAVKYVGAGTVEFIFDTAVNKFYFMEMNTRLQVEHPVTEMVTGVDLVEWQLRVASGENIPLKQDNIILNGNSIEARIYAENVKDNFLPTAGHINLLNTPKESDTVRVETGIRGGDDVSVHYDPMIAKLVVWEQDGKQAFRSLEQSLAEFNIVGIENNVDFLRKLCNNSDLVSGNVHTGFIEDHRGTLMTSVPSDDIFQQVAVGVVLTNQINAQKCYTTNPSDPFEKTDCFRINNSYMKKVKFLANGKEHIADVTCYNNGTFKIKIGDISLDINKASLSEDNGFSWLRTETEKNIKLTKMAFADSKVYTFDKVAGDYVIELVKDSDWGIEGTGQSSESSQTISPMPGVVEKINVKKGDMVKKGDPVAIIIAMKMEYVIRAPRDGKVAEVYFSQGDNIGKNVPIVKFADE